MVKRRLYVPAISVPCKQVFLKAGLVINNNKTRLKLIKLNKLTSLIFKLY